MELPMLNSEFLASACGARVNGAARVFSSVTIDSRRIEKNALFVALKGENFDGHQFVAQAIAAGAIGLVVEQDISAPENVVVLKVSNTLKALQDMARAQREAFSGKVVAITGSNGKTTTKQMIASILRAHYGDAAILATEGNLNNHIGVPLTLLRITAAHQIAVVEMGMNHFDELSVLTRIAQPDVAVITNAGPAHLEGVGSLMGVAKAKGEIFEGLNDQGVAILNRDDTFFAYWQVITRNFKQISFGFFSDTDVTGAFAPASRLTLSVPALGQRQTIVDLPLVGEHNARNALAAAAVAYALDVPIPSIASGLSVVTNVEGRLTRKQLVNGTQVIDDSYNANPASMRAAIDVLRASPGKRFLVLGDMAELGTETVALHRNVALYAASANLDAIFTLGPKFRSTNNALGPRAASFDALDELVCALGEKLDARTTILVKGAHSMAMHRVIERLEDRLREAA
jgi:UDP-N-acetylmuramoyl-tripeptide--D-alanyl-D-alanine ligase